MLKTNVYMINGRKITYSFRPNSRDCRHLVVFFSGYRPFGTFDMAGSSVSNLKCAILWIEDQFDGNHAYYIRTRESEYRIADDIQSLIQHFLSILSLEKSDCTLAGFSKGASGAIYHALKYNYNNVLAAAPRMNMGTANRKRHPDVFENMAASDDRESIEELDTVIPKIVYGDTNLNRNIYLFSSPADYQYNQEIEPYLPLFSKYNNFNFIRTDSPLVIEHRNVTSYNVGLIVSILACCSEGLAPRFGQLNSIGDNSRVTSGRKIPSRIDAQHEDFGVAVAGFSKFRITPSKFEVRGWGLSIGHQATRDGSVECMVKMRSENNTYTLSTRPEDNPKLNSDYFRNSFIDYRKAGFVLSLDQLFEIADIEPGHYEISVDFRQSGYKFSTAEFDSFPEPSQQPVLIANKLYSLRGYGRSLSLIVANIINYTSDNKIFTVNDSWLKDGKFHIDGIFAVEGRNQRDWSDVNYLLVFASPDSGKPIWSIGIAKDHGSVPRELFGDVWNQYRKVKFATRKYAGVEVPEAILNKPWEIIVSIQVDNSVHSKSLGIHVLDDNLKLGNIDQGELG